MKERRSESRRGRGALQAQRVAAPFSLPILCPADGVEPVDGVLPDLGFVEGCCDARQPCLESVAVRGTRLVPEGFAGRNAGAGRLPLGPHRVGHLRAEPVDAATRGARWSA